VAENTVKIRLEAQGIQTLGQLEAAIKKAKTELKNLPLSGAERDRGVANLVALKEAAGQLGRETYTQNAKMMQSYFSLGEELRRNRLAVVELAGASGFDRAGLGSVMRALAGGGGILAVVGGLTALINLVRDTNAEIKKLDEQISDLSGDRLPWLLKHLEELQNQDKSWFAKLAGGHSGLGLLFGLLASKEAKENTLGIKKALEEIDKLQPYGPTRLIYEQSLLKMEQDRADAAKKIADETERELKARYKLFTGPLTPAGTAAEMEIEEDVKRRRAQGIYGPRREEGGLSNIEEAKNQFNLLEQSSLALGDTLTSSLGNAFTQVFGQANSLLEQFAERLFQILGEQFILGVLSLATGLPLGGFNLGGTGAGRVVGSGSGLAKGGGAQLVEMRVKGGDLIAAVEYGYRELNRK